MENGFTCVSCKRYFSSHYFDTGPGGYYVEHDGELHLGGDATDGDIPYWYCEFCDRKGGNNPDNPFYYDESRNIPWPYPEDFEVGRKIKDIKE